MSGNTWKYARRVPYWIETELERDIADSPGVQQELRALADSLVWHGTVYLAQHRETGASHVSLRRSVAGLDWWVDLNDADGNAEAINNEINFFHTLIGRGVGTVRGN